MLQRLTWITRLVGLHVQLTRKLLQRPSTLQACPGFQNRPQAEKVVVSRATMKVGTI